MSYAGRPPRAGTATRAIVYLAVAALLGGAVGLALVATANMGALSPLIAAAVTAPALFAADVVAGLASRRAARLQASREPARADRAVYELAEACLSIRSQHALAAALDELFSKHLEAGSAALWIAGGDGAWTRVGEGAGEASVDPDVAGWLAEQREPIAALDVPKARPSELRAPLEALLRELEATLLIPLVDRERLLGAIAASGSAARQLGREALGQVQQAASRTLTYLELLREAEARVGVAREGEVTAAVQHVSEPGLREHLGGSLSITSHYQPAESFGGDFFSAAELADGRTLVAIGDVAGRGMPAALISAAVAGAFEAAERLLSPGASILDVVDHFNRLVAAVGCDRYAMSCFFALFEPDGRSMTFADAGHPFPYVCRPSSEGDAELRALVARGVPLGLEPEPHVDVVTAELEEGDAIVLYTDAVVEATAPGGGSPYGDRRLRRLLRSKADSPRLCQAIAGDVLEYCGARPLHDDMTVAVVRVGAPPPRSSRISRPLDRARGGRVPAAQRSAKVTSTP